MMSAVETPKKPDVMLELLASQQIVSVVFDARRTGVEIPDSVRQIFAGQIWYCRFDYGYRMAIPLLDLHVDQVGIRCTLSFNRCPALTFIPWSAAYLIMRHSPTGVPLGVGWPADFPPEVPVVVQEEDRLPEPQKATIVERIGTDADELVQETAPAQTEDEVRARRSAFKVVK